MFEWLKRRKAKRRFAKSVDLAVHDEILKHSGESEDFPPPRIVDASIMFTDLTGFGALTEENTAKQIVELLNNYISRMNAVVSKHNGTIDRFEGDAMMIEFGVPIAQPDHARNAVLCALEMQEELACMKDENSWWPDLQLRVGIASGEVAVAVIGGATRYTCTVVGYPVNLAEGLEAASQRLGSSILCSERTYHDVADLVFAEAVTNVQYHEEGTPVTAYTVRGLK